MNKKEQAWIDNTQQSILNIRKLITSQEEYDIDFVKLATFMLETNVNPYAFLPEEWAECINSAQSMEGFLEMLRHAMVDDGDFRFIETDKLGSFIIFTDSDMGTISNHIYNRFKYFTDVSRKNIVFSVHQDVDRFIQSVNSYSKC